MRTTGEYRVQQFDREVVRAFVPRPLPPTDPPLLLNDDLTNLHRTALAAVDRLAVAGVMVPSADWFPAIRLWETLPSRPIVTLATATSLIHTSKPTAAKAIGSLCKMSILQEISGRRRDRVYAYQTYLAALTNGDA